MYRLKTAMGVWHSQIHISSMKGRQRHQKHDRMILSSQFTVSSAGSFDPFSADHVG